METKPKYGDREYGDPDSWFKDHVGKVQNNNVSNKKNEKTKLRMLIKLQAKLF